jgi:hypothetical protein
MTEKIFSCPAKFFSMTEKIFSCPAKFFSALEKNWAEAWGKGIIPQAFRNC